ncbi:MAG: PA2778 family cysteine peptidase [Pseudomonadota bacterium]|nr:hypothetical protein [Pseudomonadales bacterium]MDY6920917.1 PA2778 family cysteine peptidase [Pseudomonadota bacterium]
MRWWWLGISLLLAGCSLHPPVTLTPEFSASLPPQAEITETPFIDQPAFQCGPAAMAMVLQYHGLQADTDSLARQVFSPGAAGSFPVEMDVASRRRGLISYPINAFEDLLREIAAGNPVLVLQNLGTSWYPRWHFAVVVGYSLPQRELILRSGNLPRRITGFTLFDTTWQRSERWGRVILPPRKIPATAQPMTYLRLASSLESSNPAAARRAHRTAIETWPQEPLAYFALANQELGRQQWQAAIDLFTRVLALRPQLAAGWNNLAYALDAAGCPKAAQTAALCAIELAPKHAAFRDTLQELSPGKPQPDSHHPVDCAVPACPSPPTTAAP